MWPAARPREAPRSWRSTSPTRCSRSPPRCTRRCRSSTPTRPRSRSRDGSFDAVVAAFLMPHVSDLPAVYTELARVVRPGGRLALATWDPEPENFTRFLFDSIAESGATPPPSLPPGPPFFQYARSDEFTALLSGAGLSDVSVSAHRLHPLRRRPRRLLGRPRRRDGPGVRADPRTASGAAGADTALVRRTARAVASGRRVGPGLRGQARRRDTNLTQTRLVPLHDPRHDRPHARRLSALSPRGRQTDIRPDLRVARLAARAVGRALARGPAPVRAQPTRRSKSAFATGISTPFTAGFTPSATQTSRPRAASSPPSRPAARPPP